MNKEEFLGKRIIQLISQPRSSEVLGPEIVQGFRNIVDTNMASLKQWVSDIIPLYYSGSVSLDLITERLEQYRMWSEIKKEIDPPKVPYLPTGHIENSSGMSHEDALSELGN